MISIVFSVSITALVMIVLILCLFMSGTLDIADIKLPWKNIIDADTAKARAEERRKKNREAIYKATTDALPKFIRRIERRIKAASARGENSAAYNYSTEAIVRPLDLEKLGSALVTYYKSYGYEARYHIAPDRTIWHDLYHVLHIYIEW